MSDETSQSGTIDDGSEDEPRVEASTMPDRSDGTTPIRPWRRTLLFVALGLVASIGVAFAGDRALHGGETLRGVVVAERALGGSDEAQVRAALESLDQELGTTPLAIRVRDQAIELDPRSVGFRIDVDAMVARVMASGREGNLGQQLWWWLGRLRKPAAVGVEAPLGTASLGSRLACRAPASPSIARLRPTSSRRR